MGTVCDTPSPQSSTIPVVRPVAYRDSTAWPRQQTTCQFRHFAWNLMQHDQEGSTWIAIYMAGTLKVSNMIYGVTSCVNIGHRIATVNAKNDMLLPASFSRGLPSDSSVLLSAR